MEQQLSREFKSLEHYVEGLFMSDSAIVNQVDPVTQAIVPAASESTETAAETKTDTPAVADATPAVETAATEVKTDGAADAAPVVAQTATTETATETKTDETDTPAVADATPAVETPTTEIKTDTPAVADATPAVETPAAVATPKIGQIYRGKAKEYFLVEGTAKSIDGEDLVIFFKIGEVVAEGKFITTYVETLATVNNTFELAFTMDDIRPLSMEYACICSGGPIGDTAKDFQDAGGEVGQWQLPNGKIVGSEDKE